MKLGLPSLMFFAFLAQVHLDQASAVVVMTDLIPDVTMGELGINSFNVDINGDGIRDVRMISQGGTTGFRAIPDSHVMLQSVNDSDPGTFHAWKISLGESIGLVPLGGSEWINNPVTGSGLTTCVTIMGIVCTGQYTMQTGFIGVEMTLADGVHYGWIDVQGFLGSGSIRAYAWETQPGIAITAPEPSRVALLLSMLIAWLFRRRRALGSG